jgi:hypothetical protein
MAGAGVGSGSAGDGLEHIRLYAAAGDLELLAEGGIPMDFAAQRAGGATDGAGGVFHGVAKGDERAGDGAFGVVKGAGAADLRAWRL